MSFIYNFEIDWDWVPNWIKWTTNILVIENSFPGFVEWKHSLGKIKQTMPGLETLGYESSSFMFNYLSLMKTLILSAIANGAIILLLLTC
jgi:hypothetical protein